MANSQTKFLLLNGRVGWQAALLDHTILSGDVPKLQLQPLPGAVRPLADASGSFGGFTDPAGLAVSACGEIYVLDSADCVIKRFDPCAQLFNTLSCVGGKGFAPRQLQGPKGIAISPQDNLYVADTGNYRVQVFSLKGLALRAIWGPLLVKQDPNQPIQVEQAVPEFPAPTSGCLTGPIFPAGTWQPWDVAVSLKGWIYISDYTNGLIHIFDPAGQWRKAFGGDPAAPLLKPTRIAVDCEDRVYVVQGGKNTVTVLDQTGAPVASITQPNQVQGNFRPIAVALDSKGNLYISESVRRCIYRYCMGADGTYSYTGNCGPLVNFGAVLAFDSKGNPLAVSLQESQVLQLAAQASFEPQGRYFSEPLDSRTYKCVWHRIAISGSIKPGARVRVDTLTSESPKTTAEVTSLPEDRWATGQVDSKTTSCNWDCMIQSPPGRYLWLRLTLDGDTSVTPVIDRVRVYFPRASSLQYLPAVYSEDPTSQDFLSRFLSMFDTVRGGIANKITNIARYFDPAATPSNCGASGQTDFLTWLASWLGLALDSNWPVKKRRELVEQAYRLYALRGKAEGLQLHIKIYTGVEPKILESFKLRRWTFLNRARLGDVSALWGDAVVARLQLDENSRIGQFQLVDSGDPLHDPFDQYAYKFTVFVPFRGQPTPLQTATVNQIIEMSKPAYTQAQLVWVDPRFRIGIQAFVGVDTVIASYPKQTQEGQGKLGYNTVIGPAAGEGGKPTMRVGKQARIASSTLLD